jgi:hypothetical protein
MPPRRLVTIVTVASLLAARTLSAQPSGYAIRTAFPLTTAADRMRGRFELLEDARITPSMRSAVAESYGMDPCAAPVTPVLRPLCEPTPHEPLRPALLRLLDASGHVLATRQAERPLAELATRRLYASARRTFLFTVDLSAGIGSYSGPLTRLAEPGDHSFGWVMVADSATGATDTLTLVSTLKSGWRAVPSVDGPGQDLLQVLCRPDFSAPDSASHSARFLVTFERYTFDGRRWKRRRRQEPGCWEADDSTSFPARGRFP